MSQPILSNLATNKPVAKTEAAGPPKVEAPLAGSAAAPKAIPAALPLTQAPIIEEHLPPVLGEITAWDIYNNEARKVDNELVKDWSSSLNSLLVFAAIFAAVLAAFIIESKKLLEPDTNSLILDVMILYTNNIANGTHTPYTPTRFEASGTAISINCLLFGSLSASLVAALASVVSLQWVAEYDAAITRGGSSPEDRAKRRQFRFGGVEKWKMGGIIAALPLVLYFSVVLFFAGVIQWMLYLNPTVGYMVVTGAGIAGLFYVSSTAIAVLFVSAPFKTPLTRWLYLGYRLGVVVLHWMLAKARVNPVPPWIETARYGFHIAHKREDLAVSSYEDLRYEAMDWLVNQVSISEDSHSRLVLLASNLLDWAANRLESREFKHAPWVSILNMLAQKHLNNAHVRESTPEEEHELAILLRCSALPGIKDIITPSDKHEYCGAISSELYWQQHCTNSQGLRSTSTMKVPDALFLLARDLPIPSQKMKDEMQAMTLLVKWRNCHVKPVNPAYDHRKILSVWNTVFESKKIYSDAFFNSLVCFIGAYASSEIPFDWKLSNAFQPIIAAIAQRAIKGTISSSALNILIQTFERTMSVYNTPLCGPSTESQGCISRPLEYARCLSNGADTVRGTHRTLTLLLTRDLRNWEVSERSRRLRDVLGMLWLNPFTQPGPSKLVEPLKIHGALCTMEDLDRFILNDWVFYVDDSKETRETIRTLIEIYSQAQLPPTVPVTATALVPAAAPVSSLAPGSAPAPVVDIPWISRCGSRSRGHLFSLLKIFDKLVSEDQKTANTPGKPPGPVSPTVTVSPAIFKILRAMLKTEAFKNCGERPYTEGREFPLRLINDPYLRMIAHCALEVYTFNNSIVPILPTGQSFNSHQMIATTGYVLADMQETDHPIIWEFRAKVVSERLPILAAPGSQTVFNGAFKTPGRFALLEKLFSYQTSCSHKFEAGHVLRHVDPRWVITFRGPVTLFGGLSLQGLKLCPLLALLSILKAEDLSFLELPSDYNKECFARAWEYVQSLKTNQSSFLRFLVELSIAPIYMGPGLGYSIKPEALAIILQAMEDTLGSPIQDDSIPVLRPMAKRALFVPRSIYRPLPSGAVMDPATKLLTQYGDHVHNMAATRLATMLIIGKRNRNLLSCARPMSGNRPAIGWRPMHVD